MFDVSAALACHCSLRPLYVELCKQHLERRIIAQRKKSGIVASIMVRWLVQSDIQSSIHSLDATTRCVMFLSETKHHTSMA